MITLQFFAARIPVCLSTCLSLLSVSLSPWLRCFLGRLSLTPSLSIVMGLEIVCVFVCLSVVPSLTKTQTSDAFRFV